jgi:hypothetical protein
VIKTVRTIAAAVGLLAPVMLFAQQPADTTKAAPADTTKPVPAAPPASVSIPIDFSGILYANYQYRGDAGAAKSQNKFELERAYLTFRMPAGDRASIRITADVFQQQTAPNDAFYRGWVIRAKYAYLQYDYLKNATGWNGLVRGGMLHNVVIEHIETFWPRWISQTPIERSGAFSSSDLGIANALAFPNRLGELYATIVNGPGYQSRETDRFKDYAARLTLTPFSGSSNRIIKTFALTGWTYIGAIGSQFAAGGPLQIGPVGVSMPRTRSGIFVGVRDPRLSIGAEWSTRKDARETGANTVLSPRVEIDTTGKLIDGFITAKPFQLLNDKSTFPLGLIARWDRFKPNTALPGYINLVIAGLTWDLNKRTALALDYQEQTPHSAPGVPTTKTYFLHLVANY